MSTTLWFAISAAVVLLVGYLLVMRVLFRRSRELDKQIDFSKIKKIEDDDA